MRRLSSPSQAAFIPVIEPGEVDIDDPVLPAARELGGAAALDVLRPAVVAAGGILHDARCTQIHYVPGRELVARYDCDITWPTGRAHDVLLAATTSRGSLPGTIAVTADTSTSTLEASVWRWPFDPVVIGLPIATSPTELACHLGHVVAGALRVDVVAYRPTERAVVRVTDSSDRTFYLKVLSPGHVAAIAARHEALRAAGICAPEVLFADIANGLLLLEALPGTTLRDRIKSGRRGWPDLDQLTCLLQAFDTPIAPEHSGPVRAARTRDAIAHAKLLSTVAPELSDMLAALETRFDAALDEVEQRSGAVVHGDLHEAQLFVDDTGAITGIIDLDDLGPGDPLDDPAVLLGHLEYRAITAEADTADMLYGRIIELRSHFAAIHGEEALDLTVAAVLVGLATGPFRSRSATWPQLTATVLDAADRHAAGTWHAPTPLVAT